ncbi:DUF4177 domain-containing protein [Tateyamaria sp.]|uniref:DUF4177 domain-containing protein n=1 Tax=Tateyamaria sp. TaxID=1929288 RepID=UPI00329E5FD1
MSGWEYKVVPAPKKGIKGPGIKGAENRFANALEALMNQMGAEGWEYQRAETLPSVERAGLTGSNTEWRNLLVFRRALVDAIDDFEPELLPPPVTISPVPMASLAVDTPQADTPEPVDAAPSATADHDAAATPDAQSQPATQSPADNGVEDINDAGDVTAPLKKLVSQRLEDKSTD